jgi:hypothetical protein
MPSLAYLAVFVIFLDVAATPFGPHDSEATRASSPPTASNLCPSFNRNTKATADGAQLIQSTGSNETLLECRYFDSDVCSYSQGVSTLCLMPTCS